MASTVDRLNKIIADNLDLDGEPDFNAQLSDTGISSLEAVAFYKVVNEEFGLGLVEEDCLQFKTFGELAAHIDARG